MQPAWWRRPSTLPLMMLVFAILIISFGGAIRIHDAGESCPDWPKCFGTYGFDISEEEQEAYWEENPDEIAVLYYNCSGGGSLKGLYTKIQ